MPGIRQRRHHHGDASRLSLPQGKDQRFAFVQVVREIFFIAESRLANQIHVPIPDGFGVVGDKFAVLKRFINQRRKFGFKQFDYFGRKILMSAARRAVKLEGIWI